MTKKNLLDHLDYLNQLAMAVGANSKTPVIEVLGNAIIKGLRMPGDRIETENAIKYFEKKKKYYGAGKIVEIAYGDHLRANEFYKLYEKEVKRKGSPTWKKHREFKKSLIRILRSYDNSKK